MNSAVERSSGSFPLSLAKPVEARRLAALIELFNGELAHYQEQPDAAKALYGKTVPLPPGARLPEMAAFTVVANVLLNMDALLMKG